MKAIISASCIVFFFSPAHSQLLQNYADSARIFDSLANRYYYQGKYDSAEPLFLKAKRIQEISVGKDNQPYAAICVDLANLYDDKGYYDKALPLYSEAMKTVEKLFGTDNRHYAMACMNFAVLLQHMGRDENAKLLYLQAKDIIQRVLGKSNPTYAACCMNLAIVYKDLAQYDQAEQLYLEALRIQETVAGKDNPQYASECCNLADLYDEMGQYEKAEALYLEARQIQAKVLGKDNPNYASDCQNLAIVYYHMNKYDKAEALYLEAKGIQAKILGKTNPQYANTCLNLAIIYKDTKQFEKSELLILEARQVFVEDFGKDDPRYAKCCENLSNLNRELGQYEKAEQLCQEAKQIRKKIFGREHPDYGWSCQNLASLYRLMHRPMLADEEYQESFFVRTNYLFSVFQFTDEKEKTAYVHNILGEDDGAYSFYLAEKIKSGQPYSISLFHRNLILYASRDLKKQLYYTGDTALVDKYNQWKDLKLHLSNLYSRPVSERKEDPAVIEEEASRREKELVRLSANFKSWQQRTDWKDIQKKLQGDEASIEFASFHFTDGKRVSDSMVYVALVLRKDSPLPRTVYLFNENRLKDLLYATGNTITKDGVATLYASRGVIGNNKPAADRSIYDLVWKPLEKELTGVRTIYFAPSGMLHRIAFAALPLNKRDVLSDRYKLVQVASTASVPDLSPTFITPSDNLRLYGGIDYGADSTFAYLPGTVAEIDSIESLAKTRKIKSVALTGTDATEGSFKELDGKASPSVIHLATHGFFFPDPKNKPTNIFQSSDNPLLRSGLLLAGSNLAWQGKPVEGQEDGILTAYEVSNMYLPNTKLVVLSACETALGDIRGSEGVYGLQRAFKIAGVTNLVMSLWRVPDKETVEFMQTFYNNLFVGKSISNAFYQAQNTLKAKYRSDPYKWAAWVLVR
jgi:CHAT domain-containing protein/tetratricopeptide (TPR) repeat protein